MAAKLPIASVKYTLDAVTWTSIKSPIYADDMEVINLSTTLNVKIRTDSADATTERTLFSMGTIPYSSNGRRRERFEPDQAVLYAQSVSGSPDILVTFQ